ncbi:nucleotidyltransferase domain-containing protein [Gandjariella thermophila]|uniref:Nucleotidyltransferase n=1 Tax=Gandjariella thermophila TaxID=1931992 RepID=A0A4D4JA73_9PSEU|nr:nucleotidyltransferase domain-containing protein [Gandjariella thermophila]GDY30827.1 nucleotidyltransferase [Gandjariella thermophila]
MTDHGLDADGYLRREGSLDRVPAPFAPVVADLRESVSAAFGPRLHSVYLYGSIPRGTAVPGRSDLDAVILLRDTPGDADQATVRRLNRDLDARHDVVDGAGLLLWSVATVLDPAERYNLGFMLACLCTLLLGEDISRRLPRYRPTVELARGANGDIGAVLARCRARVGADDTAALCRRVARKLVRTGFTLVMPRWRGWTSDLAAMVEAFAHYYPDRAADMERATQLARAPSDDPAVVLDLIDGLGTWLTAEYARAVT